MEDSRRFYPSPFRILNRLYVALDSGLKLPLIINASKVLDFTRITKTGVSIDEILKRLEKTNSTKPPESRLSWK